MNWLGIDTSVLLWINGLSGNLKFVDSVGRSIANDYFAIVCGCLVMLAIWVGARDSRQRYLNQKGVMLASSSLGTSQGVVELINSLWDRPRPFHVMEVNLVFYTPTDPSFPSNSATILFAMAWGVFMFNRKAGLLLLGLAAMHGFCRVYVGVHYPSDILGGAVIGLLVSLFFLAVFRILKPVVDRLTHILRWFFLA